MMPWCERIIEQEDRKLFKKIKKLINRLPDMTFRFDQSGSEIIISCHLLARAVYAVWPEEFIGVRTGYFMDYFDHSWLITARGNVLDIYPVGCLGGPLLYSGLESSPVFLMYRENGGVKITNGISEEKFNSCLKTLVQKIKEII